MAIPNQTPYNIFTANGISTVFPYEFYLLNAFDLTVSINGVEQSSGFTISGIGNVDGGEVTFLTPPANGSVILLERVVPTYRLTEYQDNGDLLAETVNKDFDRLWMAIQQAFVYLGLALTRPLLGGPFNAHGYRIENLGDPINPQDAVTKKWFADQNAISLARTLRVPENAVNQLPNAAARANSIQGFDSGGQPVPIFSWTETTDLSLALASHSPPGARLVGLPFGTVNDAIKFYTPEMFGAVGDGVTDDYHSIRMMLDETPAGATFFFDGSKTYYNDFANDGTWRDLLDRNMWIRDRAATFFFNGARLTRRQPKWADENAKNNNNTGPFYTDQDTAMLYLTGTGPFYIDKPNINASNPIGYIKNVSGNNTSAYGYASCECRDYGIYLQDTADVFITGALIYRACFNIYALRVNNLNVNGRLYQSGQAWKMISSDLAFGAGIKTLHCTDVKIDVLGDHNTNATVEIEPNNAHVHLKCKSDSDYANAIVIYDSQFVDFDVTATNVVNGSWMQIIQGANGSQVKNIRGNLVGDKCSWAGLYIRMTSAASADMRNIDIKLVGTGAALTAYWADQTPAAATGKVMKDINVQLDAYDNASGTAGGFGCHIRGDVRGTTSGRISNAYIGILCDGGNNVTFGHKARLDLTDNVISPFSVSGTNYVDWFGTTTATELRLMSLAPRVTMSRASVLGGEKDYSNIWLRSTVLQFANLPIDPVSPVQYQFYAHQTKEGEINVFTGRMKY